MQVLLARAEHYGGGDTVEMMASEGNTRNKFEAKFSRGASAGVSEDRS